MKTYTLDSLTYEMEEEIRPYGSIFGTLSDDMRIEVYEPKENIVYFGRPLRYLRYLIKGKAKITLVHEDGKQSIIHFVKPDEYIGELTFLDIEQTPKNITAICECVFLSIPMDLAIDVLKKEPKFLFKLNQFIGRKMLNRTDFSSKNQNYELKNRLAAYILMSEHEGMYTEKHTETTEYLGVSYRHLLYTLKEFADSGLIEKKKKGYYIHREPLKILAKDIEMV